MEPLHENLQVLSELNSLFQTNRLSDVIVF